MSTALFMSCIEKPKKGKKSSTISQARLWDEIVDAMVYQLPKLNSREIKSFLKDHKSKYFITRKNNKL